MISVFRLVELQRTRREESLKYLVIGESNPNNMDAQFKKAKEWFEDKEKHPDKYPDTIFPTHFMLNKSKFIAVWDTDDQEKITNKIAFMLPEVWYKVIPLIDGMTFMKQYMEIKK